MVASSHRNGCTRWGGRGHELLPALCKRARRGSVAPRDCTAGIAAPDRPRLRHRRLRRRLRVGDEIQSQTADRNTEIGVSERVSHGIPGFEADRGAGTMRPGKFDLLSSSIDRSKRAGAKPSTRASASMRLPQQTSNQRKAKGRLSQFKNSLAKPSAGASHPLVVGCSGTPFGHIHSKGIGWAPPHLYGELRSPARTGASGAG
jgi:hypothetical protein